MDIHPHGLDVILTNFVVGVVDRLDLFYFFWFGIAPFMFTHACFSLRWNPSNEEAQCPSVSNMTAWSKGPVGLMDSEVIAEVDVEPRVGSGFGQ